jgi:hypothetical protein
MFAHLIPTLLFILWVIFFLKNGILFAISYDEDQNEFPEIVGSQIDKFEVEEVMPEKERRDKYSRTIVTPDRLVFHIAPDRPLEKYAAYSGPIGMDSYVYYKFKEQESMIKERFYQMNQRIADLENKISELKTLVSRPQVLMPQEPAPPAPEATPPEVESKLY